MDNLVSLLKIYDQDNDSRLTKAEFNNFCNDIQYKFNESETNLFKLDDEIVSFDQIINAVNYIPKVSNSKFFAVLKSLAENGSNKVFVPELINILKHSKELMDNNKLDELLSILPIEDNYLLLDKL